MAAEKKGGRSIRKRLILLLLFVLIPVSGIQAYFYYQSFQARRASELQANLEIARAIGKTFERFVKDVLHQELAIGLALTSSQELSPEHGDRILLRSHADNPGIWQFFWSSPSGVVLSATGSQFIGMRLGDRDYFKQIVAGQDYVISDLLLSRTTGKPSFTISRGIRNEKGVLLGIIIAGILPERLDEELGVKRFTGGGLALVDRKGMLVYRYPAIEATWEERNWLKQYPEFEDVFKGKEVTAIVYAPFEGKKRLVGFTPVSSIGWAATAGTREEEVVNSILLDISKSGALFLSVSILGFLIALSLSRSISSPIAALRNFALALGRGEKNRQPPPTHKIPEFQDLADALYSMSEKVREREMALRESEEKYRTTLASVGDAVIASDFSGKITFMNKIAEELTGWTVSEASTKPVADVFHIINEHTRNRVEDPVAKVLKEGVIVGLANHSVLVGKSGREIPIDDSGAPIRDQDGRIMGVVLIFRDITERKRAEEERKSLLNTVREEKDRLSALINSMQDEVWYADTEKNFTLTNPSALHEFGLNGMTDVDVRELAESLEVFRSDGTPRPVEEAPPLRALQGEVITKQEEIIRTPRTGELRVRQVSASPVKDTGGHIIGSVSIVRDITEHRQAEEALKKRSLELQHLTETLEERVKERTAELLDITSRLVSAQEDERKRVSYDLHDNVWQTLLAIRSEIERLFSGGEGKDWGALQERSNKVMASILEAVVKIRSMQGDLWPYVLDDIGLLATLDWYCREFEKANPRMTIERQHGLTESEIPSSAKIVIYRILQETLSNVAKYSRATRVTLRILKRDHGIEFAVEDNGIGFDPEETIARKGPWGGLGLSSIKARTELSGGSFSIQTAKGKGTTIRAAWPV
jgi:PAS domain S-box-containing protein